MVTNYKDPNTSQIGLDNQNFLWIDITNWLESVDLTMSLHGEFPLFPLVILSVLILLCHSFCLFLYFLFRSQEPFVFCFLFCFLRQSFYVVLTVLDQASFKLAEIHLHLPPGAGIKGTLLQSGTMGLFIPP